MQEKYASKGLIVAAPHRQDGDKNQIIAKLKQMGCNYSVYSTGSIQGDNSSGIPRAFVFDHLGALRFEGHPSDGKFNKTVEDLMKAAPDWLTGGKEYTKIQSEAKNVEGRRNLGKTHSDLKEKMESSDETTKNEATELFEVLDRYAKSELAKIEAKKDNGAS